MDESLTTFYANVTVSFDDERFETNGTHQMNIGLIIAGCCVSVLLLTAALIIFIKRRDVYRCCRNLKENTQFGNSTAYTGYVSPSSSVTSGPSYMDSQAYSVFVACPKPDTSGRDESQVSNYYETIKSYDDFVADEHTQANYDKGFKKAKRKYHQEHNAKAVDSKDIVKPKGICQINHDPKIVDCNDYKKVNNEVLEEREYDFKINFQVLFKGRESRIGFVQA